MYRKGGKEYKGVQERDGGAGRIRSKNTRPRRPLMLGLDGFDLLLGVDSLVCGFETLAERLRKGLPGGERVLVAADGFEMRGGPDGGFVLHKR